ncbi:ras-related protein Rab-32 isoform X1 [Clinocottus analis]|uniref:ras-related protein Rab-32 isoform X1 n=1 Tax=Clinocottus analis TaxID=304258 RepID=UPI0035BF1DCD
MVALVFTLRSSRRSGPGRRGLHHGRWLDPPRCSPSGSPETDAAARRVLQSGRGRRAAARAPKQSASRAGQERYGNMTRVYYREAVGALVVFDMTRLSTFQAVLKWKGDLDSKVALNNGTPVPAVLLANKCDQRSRGLCPKLPKLENFSRQSGFVGWYETSAKDDTNIDAAITCLVKSIMTAEDERASSDAASSAAAKPKADGGVLVLPRFDYGAKEKGPAGCSGCPSLQRRDDD